jgi:hypothetical protein
MTVPVLHPQFISANVVQRRLRTNSPTSTLYSQTKETANTTSNVSNNAHPPKVEDVRKLFDNPSDEDWKMMKQSVLRALDGADLLSIRGEDDLPEPIALRKFSDIPHDRLLLHIWDVSPRSLIIDNVAHDLGY